MDEKPDKNPVKWSQADKAMLLQTLVDEKAKANWGDNNPKKVAWTACERALTDSKKKSGETPKSIQSIKNRWQRLKQEYDVMKEIRGLSGFGWDPILNTVTAENDVWDAYIKDQGPSKAKLVKKFRTKPLLLFDAVSELVDGRPSISVLPPPQPCAPEPTLSDFAIDPTLDDISLDMGMVLGDETGTQTTVPPSGRSTQTKEASASFYGSDRYSSEDDNTQDIVPASQAAPSQSKRKRVESTGPSKESQKPRHVSAGQGMTEMARSLQDVFEHMKKRQEEKVSSTQQDPRQDLDKAIELLSEDATLDDDEFMEVVDHFSNNLNFARAYTTMRTPLMHAMLIWRRLKKLHGE
ncbi:Myb/SANT-like DNA-binding domain-containing protein [Lactarius akahatsu]|uniref:Myb/SANT-like DNA-binding domain-containing protein n=1 Tax=Lactarius akahatsu TaxID=416441 RepID=A0AAD4LJS7_9AGAM|nr:Myb/SANT-like DNA-binding domain-containing protein [Lactarius akahatsu]